ncbi:hypothetical protein [Streptomyces sp. NRRL S-481]|uniref:hypothetical protein n=1 Tax=Streptomyces sp. NRRL S-481 TaxID=1463911 RepID=UPI0004C48F86|nr:hypothetical protein [Streptomyces sp. NRRL S-481]
MDPMMVRTVVTAGSALSRFAVRATLGSDRQRALDGVYRRAIERAVEEVSADEGITDFDLVHAVSLLEQMVSAAADGDLPLLAPEEVDHGARAHRWREIATHQGLDSDTFPLPFDKLVDRLLHVVAEEALDTAVDGNGNPLFPAVAAAHLVDLRRSMRMLARTIGPDGQLREALRAAYEACRERDRMLLTPDVLLALLHLPDHSVTSCFEAARPGVTPRLTRSLRRFQDTPVEPFRPFEWVERAEMRQAQTYAWAHGAATVSGPLLLLGLLDTPSNTRDALVASLGDSVAVLRHTALSRMTPVVRQRTPGITFEDE